MLVLTWGSGLIFSYYLTTLCVPVLEKENLDLGLCIVGVLGALELNWLQSCIISVISPVKSLKQGAAEMLRVEFIMRGKGKANA